MTYSKRTIATRESPESVRLILISDTHELHRQCDIPHGDILIHAGDATMFSQSAASVLDFNEWLGELPHRHKIFVPGNHDSFLDNDPSKVAMLTSATVLINRSVWIFGLKVYGSPVTPLYGGAFGLSSSIDRGRLYKTMPKDTDILITHAPPFGILDTATTGESTGCKELLEDVIRVRPRLHVFGHIHGSHGIQDGEHTTFVNAALLGLDGDIAYEPIVLDMRSVPY